MHMFITEGFPTDPSDLYGVLGGRWPGQDTAFSDPETDQIMKELNLVADQDERLRLGRKLQRMIYEKVIYVPVGFHFRMKAKRSDIMDPEGNIGIGIMTLHNVWINR